MTQNTSPIRRTIVVAGSAAADAAHLAHARANSLGIGVLSIEALAARLAGGFACGIDADRLIGSVTEVLSALPAEALGDLGAIAGLPGVPSALAATLSKAWAAGIDLAAMSASTGPESTRLSHLAEIEAAVLARLPASMRRPGDLVAEGLARLDHAPAIFGGIEFRRLPDLDPCWRPLVSGLATVLPVTWNAGARAVPDWVLGSGAHVITQAPEAPQILVQSCANARHEVTEAMRWARALLAGGEVTAGAIALAASGPGDYDDLVLALSAEANIDVHFAHGRPALATRDGQAAAALADLLIRGLDQIRLRRLARLANAAGSPFGDLPDDWTRYLPRDAPLETPVRWRQALMAAKAPEAVMQPLLAAVDLIGQGLPVAAEAGEALLRGPARALWRKALLRAPASALESSLGALRLADTIEAATAIAWMNAETLAACPRPYVWLFGLNSRTWPRRGREDPLLPDHIVPGRDLQPRSIAMSDRESFAGIVASTGKIVSCSFGRRGADGRLLGQSALLPKAVPIHRHRARIPKHAFSEPDRLTACATEFAATPRAASAHACWRDWHQAEVTPHDGLVRPDHPVLAAALARPQSATSLKLLLRNPLGYVWTYGLHWSAPELEDETFDLDNSAFGALVHDILHLAVRDLETKGGLAAAEPEVIEAAVEGACASVALHWAEIRNVPPEALWRRRLEQAAALAILALGRSLPVLPGQRSYLEVEFPAIEATEAAPWAKMEAVVIPGTGLRIRGRIDRLDLSGDGRMARVIDYKTGALKKPVVLDGGRELQRCLYAYAVEALLGAHLKIEAALFYPHGGRQDYRPLEDQVGTLAILTAALRAAKTNLLQGLALPGRDAGDTYDDGRFALPASPGSFLSQKQAAAENRLGAAAEIWNAP